MPRMFKSLSGTVNQIVRNLDKVANKAIDENLSVMADMNVEQMMDGKNIEGDDIGRYGGSGKYAAMKQDMNPRPSAWVPDLRLEGNFHDGIFAKRNKNIIVFGSSDPDRDKVETLIAKYGAHQPFLGLTEENRAEVTNDYIFPIITDWLYQQLKQI